MSRIINCPGCTTQLKISATGESQFKCPKCGMLLKVSSPAAQKPTAAPELHATETNSVQPSADDPFAPGNSGQIPADQTIPTNSGASASSFQKPTPKHQGKRHDKSAAGDLQPFMRKWFMFLGAVCGLAIVLAIAGLFVEIAGLAAAIVCMLTAIGCVFGGRFWIAIMLSRKNALEGAAAVFVPLLGILWALTRKGELLKGAIVFASSLVPCLLGLACVAIFAPDSSRSSARSNRIEARALEALQKDEPGLPISDSVTTVVYTVGGLNQGRINLANGADTHLKQFKHYVPGSFTFDRQTNTAVLKHRGNDKISLHYRYILGGHFKVFLHEKKTE